VDSVKSSSNEVTSHHMEKTEAGLQRPLYPRNTTEIQLYTTRNNSLQYYVSRCHGDLLCSHTVLTG